MPRQIRKLIFYTSIIIGLLSAFSIALYAYGSQSTLPSNFAVAGWRVGGMPYDKFQQQYEQRLKLLTSFPVQLQTSYSDIPNRQLALGELGVQYQKEALEQSLGQLFGSSLIERIKARWTLRHANIPLEVTVNQKQLGTRVKEAWKDLYSQHPVAAKRIVTTQDTLTYEPERKVLRIDTAHLVEHLKEIAPSISYIYNAAPIRLTLPLYEQSPAVTIETLKRQGIDRKISEFTTSFPTSGEGRIHNIRSTAASIQDLLMAPGEIFDYSKIIEQTEAQFGYKEAPVILNGKLVPGIGGGICQVSTTLYNAVLRSGLDIVERRNHSLPVSYVTLGQDATFASGFINFKFRNSTDAYLLIRTITTDQAVTVKLFGQMSPSITYDIDSNIVETIQPPIKYLHNASLSPGATRPISIGKAGYKVETYRIKRENGTMVSKELISKDQYSPVPTLIASNRGDIKTEEGSPPAPVQPILEDGVKGPAFR
ncbi:Vancomycin resistance protein YoaR, contains peptidoglycan-binding and VanW domains [Paenibacillus sp. yr247]|uniref:VanW family protein n=1 Tax=Paenibacillus sp. yr247 TaxID=1761880 RepID=UPI00087E5DDA|nr:VanW family protein [Paenibacillus sp. yr247]SDP00575.1 Vancomycin resistance protein YoaR, contains peptidoglycan-binding and VanW domains [Paenibacillus sp. yr247]